jgi:hypothetical protein
VVAEQEVVAGEASFGHDSGLAQHFGTWVTASIFAVGHRHWDVGLDMVSFGPVEGGSAGAE